MGYPTLVSRGCLHRGGWEGARRVAITEVGCLAVVPEAVLLVMREGEGAVEDFGLRSPRTGPPMGVDRPVMVLRV